VIISQSFLGLYQTSDTLGLNSALVGSLLDLEVTVVTPGLIPRVSNQPEVDSILSSVTEGLDGVSSEEISSSVGVNSSLVGKEVLIDREGNLNWSVGGNLALHLGNSGDRVGRLTVVLVTGVRSTVRALALSRTSWGRTNRSARWVLGRGGVVSTRGEGVWLTGGLVSEKVSGNDSDSLEVSPSWTEVTSVTSLSARGAASHNVLGGDSGLDLLSGGDTDSVGHSFGGTESPA
jgi:hypothetical protein